VRITGKVDLAKLAERDLHVQVLQRRRCAGRTATADFAPA
jgi:hypothetical protein